jgi:hypothetical protein
VTREKENATQTINLLGVVAQSQAQQSIKKVFVFTEDYDKQVKRINILAGKQLNQVKAVDDVNGLKSTNETWKFAFQLFKKMKK